MNESRTSNHRGHCFLPGTMVWISSSEAKLVECLSLVTWSAAGTARVCVSRCTMFIDAGGSELWSFARVLLL